MRWITTLRSAAISRGWVGVGSVPWYYRHHTSLAWKETKTQNLSVVSGWGYRLMEEACPELFQYSKFNTQHCSSEGEKPEDAAENKGRVGEGEELQRGREEGRRWRTEGECQKPMPFMLSDPVSLPHAHRSNHQLSAPTAPAPCSLSWMVTDSTSRTVSPQINSFLSRLGHGVLWQQLKGYKLVPGSGLSERDRLDHTAFWRIWKILG